jgi:hypothetical protein
VTDPLPLPPYRRDPLDDPILQRDSARDLAALLEERNEKALRLHYAKSFTTMVDLPDYCAECALTFPCPTRRALTGADEDGAA